MRRSKPCGGRFGLSQDDRRHRRRRGFGKIGGGQAGCGAARPAFRRQRPHVPSDHEGGGRAGHRPGRRGGGDEACRIGGPEGGGRSRLGRWGRAHRRHLRRRLRRGAAPHFCHPRRARGAGRAAEACWTRRRSDGRSGHQHGGLSHRRLQVLPDRQPGREGAAAGGTVRAPRRAGRSRGDATRGGDPRSRRHPAGGGAAPAGGGRGGDRHGQPRRRPGRGPHRAERRTRTHAAMIYAFMRWLMRAITRTFLLGLFKVSGLENVPRAGPVIICPNHSATLDPPMVPAFTPRGDSWSMAKSEYFRGGFIEWVFRAYHAFPVVRHSADRTALRMAFDILESGQALIIYPEGTRVESGVLARPEPGAGFIAQTAGCPVVPVALTGTRECLPKGAKWPRRTRVTVKFGKAFTVATKRPDGTRVTHEEASDAIMTAIAELLPPERRGEFSDLESLRRRLAGVSNPA